MKNTIKKILKVILILCIVGIAALAYMGLIEPNLLINTKITVSVPDKVTESKIVFFSDTHFGKLYNQSNIVKIVNKINDADPDAVIFGGDFFDNYARDNSLLDLEFLQKELMKIKAPSGKFAIFGNHDMGGGAVRIYADFFSGAGFTVLKNSSIYFDKLGIQLTGFDDSLLGNKDESLYNLNNDSFNLLVSHEPDVAIDINSASNGLMLSGHSHGGQVWLPFVNKFIRPEGAKTYLKGLYKNCGENKNISLIVSSGIGVTMLPFRLFNPPEIVIISLEN